jgi:hypothetical protein
MSYDYCVDPQLSTLLRGMGAPKNMLADVASVLDDVTLPDMNGWEEGLISVLKEELNIGFEDEQDLWVPLHAWRMLTKARVKDAIPFLIGILVESDVDDDWNLSEIPAMLALFGADAAHQLVPALRDSPPHAAATFAMIGVVDALRMIALRDASTRDFICGELRAELSRADVYSPAVNAFIIDALCVLKDIPSIKEIKKAFAEDLVELQVVDWKSVCSAFGPRVPARAPPPSPKPLLGAFDGDEWMSRNLMIIDSRFDIDSLKFFLLGSILDVSGVSPQKQLAAVMSDRDGKPTEFVTSGQESNFYRNFFGLWNVLTSYQNKLFEIPVEKLKAEISEAAHVLEQVSTDLMLLKHLSWMGYFIQGLDVGRTLEVTFLEPKGRVLLEKIERFISEAAPLAGTCDCPRMELDRKRELVSTMVDDWTRHYLEFAGNMVQARMTTVPQKKFKVHNSSVARNDYCPCGSNKKYKNCCLQ